MRIKYYLIILLLFAANNILAQSDSIQINFELVKGENLIKDLDCDGIRDTVRVEFVFQKDINLDNYSYIVCRLSSQQFTEVRSGKLFADYLSFLEIRFGITDVEEGFEFYTDYTRGGDRALFRYDEQARDVRLTSMSRYEIGDADGDGKGESTIDLRTYNYEGDWFAYDYNRDTLFKIPTIRQEMNLGIVFLDTFDDEIISEYSSRCSSLRYEEKMKIIVRNLVH